MELELALHHTPGASVTRTKRGWRLEIPAGEKDRRYRLAQLDNYTHLSRARLYHLPPLTLSLYSRVSETYLPGTWGFGMWNDPFGLSFGFGGTAGRLPALPNAAWFFHASPQNSLSLRDDIPAQGFFAGSIRSPHWPSLLLAPGLLTLPLLATRLTSRFLRHLARQKIHQDAVAITVDVTKWHKYSIHWLDESLDFNMDGKVFLHTNISPLHPLGLIFWIDNQYAAWTREGRAGYGTLGNPDAWLEIKDLHMY